MEGNCPELEEGREEEEPDDGTAGMELLLERRDEKDTEEVTARRGRQVEQQQLPEKRKGQTGRQGISKKVKLEGEDQGLGELPITGTRPAQDNLPARQVEGAASNPGELPDRAVQAKLRQQSIQVYLETTKPISHVESKRFEEEGHGEELPGDTANCQGGTAVNCPEDAEEGEEPEGRSGESREELPPTPSIGESCSHADIELPSTCQPATEPHDSVVLPVPPELCNLNLESRSCETHNIGLVEFRQKSKKWTKCSDGLYRNVYRIQKTLRCSESTRTVTRVQNVPTSGEFKIKKLPGIKFSPRSGLKRGR